eukprot:1687990-Amphidinium_carterae.1
MDSVTGLCDLKMGLNRMLSEFDSCSANVKSLQAACNNAGASHLGVVSNHLAKEIRKRLRRGTTWTDLSVCCAPFIALPCINPLQCVLHSRAVDAHERRPDHLSGQAEQAQGALYTHTKC